MRNIEWKIISIVVVTSFILGVIYEFLGWKIAERLIDDAHFPGFMDSEVLLGGMKTAAGSLLVGLIVLSISATLPKFRSGMPQNVHKPVIVGVILLYILIGITLIQGFFIH